MKLLLLIMATLTPAILHYVSGLYTMPVVGWAKLSHLGFCAGCRPASSALPAILNTQTLRQTFARPKLEQFRIFTFSPHPRSINPPLCIIIQTRSAIHLNHVLIYPNLIKLYCLTGDGLRSLVDKFITSTPDEILVLEKDTPNLHIEICVLPRDQHSRMTNNKDRTLLDLTV